MQAKPYSIAPPEESQIIRAAASLGVMGAGDGVSTRMLILLCDPQVDPRQVSELIRAQPALCARVLRVANSPYYGQSRTVKTLERAFLVLGIDAIRGIAAAACLERTAQVCRARGILDLDALLDYSVATAVATERLSRLLRSPATPESFIAGLMHDFGVLIQLGMNPQGMAEMVAARRSQPGASMHDLEGRYLGVRHEYCAALAFESWSLPPSLIAVVTHHHQPMNAAAPHRMLVAMVNVGGVLAVRAGFRTAFESLEPALNPDVVQVLGLEEEQFDALGSELADRVAAFRGAMGD